MRKIFIMPIVMSLSFYLTAQAYQIQNLRFTPPEYFVGDTVEMSFTLRSDESMDLILPEELPDHEWVTFLSLDIEPGARESKVLIRLIPYYPGTRALPELNLGGITLRDLKIYTSSLLDRETDRSLSGIQGPLLIPGTRGMGALLFSLLMALPILFLFLFKLLRHHGGEIVKTYRLNLPYRQFQRLLRSIRRNMNSMPEKDFYSNFSKGLKNYLSSCFHKDLTSSTTLEIERILEKSQIHDTLALSLTNLFHRVDRVKFAGEKLLYGEREHLLDEVVEVSEALESWRKKHADL